MTDRRCERQIYAVRRRIAILGVFRWWPKLNARERSLGHVSSIVPRGVACPAAAFEGRRSVRLAVNSASSTIPCRASSSLISRCSHYVCQIVVWRTNLEVTPGANLRRIPPIATLPSTHPHTTPVGVRHPPYDTKTPKQN